MTKLPELFPTDQLGIIERTQIETFYTKYTGEYYADYSFGHFLMAAYAAIPAYLTPDLLYKMWQNFGGYQWKDRSEFVHPIAVNDILLAPFCREVSYELFKMEENTRLSFLKWMTSGDLLWESLQPHSLAYIAGFIENYHDRPNETMVREGAKYREDQLMEVRVYKDPKEVADFYLSKLKDARKEQNEQEILSIITSLNKAIKKENYTGYTKSKTFGALFKENELDLWKHAIQQNMTSFANLLEQTGLNQAEGGLLLLKQENNAYAIPVNNTETQLVNRLDALVKPVNYAIIIGCSTEDIDNCTLFEKTLDEISFGEKWKIQAITKKVSKETLLQNLANELRSVTPADNLIIYVGAFNATLTSNGNCQIKYFEEAITDAEFNKVLSNIPEPASLTMVVACPHAATPFWLDTNKPGYALFAATSADQKTIQNDIDTYTRAFCAVLARYQGRISNRQLYIKTILELELYSQDNGSQLLSNRKTYYRQFACDDIPDVRIQHNLRLCGYLHKTGSLAWDEETEAALQKFKADFKLNGELPGIANMVETKVEANSKEQKPLLLFIFSDKERKLPGVATEIQAIKTVLKNSILNTCDEIKVFQNRPLKEVNDFIRNTGSRNRIQLIYYSGFDHAGNPKFPDGEIELQHWCDWLSYQDNIELVVLNTCKSGLLASRLAQIGVGMAIGSYETIKDDDSAAFGSKLINAITNSRNISSLSMQTG
ncbi:MAG TPA: hypothetical protein VF008_18180 [Niastella sp.]